MRPLHASVRPSFSFPTGRTQDKAGKMSFFVCQFLSAPFHPHIHAVPRRTPLRIHRGLSNVGRCRERSRIQERSGRAAGKQGCRTIFTSYIPVTVREKYIYLLPSPKKNPNITGTNTHTHTHVPRTVSETRWCNRARGPSNGKAEHPAVSDVVLVSSWPFLCRFFFCMCAWQ